MKILGCYTLALLMVLGCGRQDDERAEGENAPMTEDSSVSEEVLSTSVTDAIKSLADSGQEATQASLAYALLPDAKVKENNKDKLREQTCTKNEDGSVTVAVSASVERTGEFEGPRVKKAFTSVGSVEISRSWSSENFELDCTAGKFVNVDWHSDVTGLALDLTAARSLSQEASLEIVKSGRTFSVSRTASSEGSRQVSWLSHEELVESSEIKRRKSLTSTMAHQHSFTNAEGKSFEFELNVATQGEAPLVIDVLRDKETLALKEKTIVSGMLVASKAGDGKVETSFENFHLVFGSDSCSIESGIVTAAFYREGESEAAKTLKLEVIDGSFTLTDVGSGEAIEDFDMPGCTLADFKL